MPILYIRLLREIRGTRIIGGWNAQGPVAVPGPCYALSLRTVNTENSEGWH
jgi:hypothetical protein